MAARALSCCRCIPAQRWGSCEACWLWSPCSHEGGGGGPDSRDCAASGHAGDGRRRPAAAVLAVCTSDGARRTSSDAADASRADIRRRSRCRGAGCRGCGCPGAGAGSGAFASTPGCHRRAAPEGASRRQLPTSPCAAERDRQTQDVGVLRALPIVGGGGWCGGDDGVVGARAPRACTTWRCWRWTRVRPGCRTARGSGHGRKVLWWGGVG